MKELANLKNVKALNKNEKKSIRGGRLCNNYQLSIGCIPVLQYGVCLCPIY